MIVDTMVFAYALLGVTQHRTIAAHILESVDRIDVPDLFRAELANVVSLWVRHKAVDLRTAFDVLEDAETLVSKVWPTDLLWERAVELAVTKGHPVYDTLFVALAETLDSRVASFDRQLKRKFPDLVVLGEDY